MRLIKDGNVFYNLDNLVSAKVNKVEAELSFANATITVAIKIWNDLLKDSEIVADITSDSPAVF